MKKQHLILTALLATVTLSGCTKAPYEVPSELPQAATEQSEEPVLTKESLMEAAELFDVESFERSAANNFVRAKEEYVGKPFFFFGAVSDIHPDYAKCDQYFFYLADETLSKLNTRQFYLFVGSVDTLYSWGAAHSCSMKPAYTVEDTMTIHGKVIETVSNAFSVYIDRVNDDIPFHGLCHIMLKPTDDIEEGAIVSIKGTLWNDIAEPYDVSLKSPEIISVEKT